GHLKLVVGDFFKRYAEAAAGAYLPIYHFFDAAAWLEGAEWAQWSLFTVTSYLGTLSALYWLIPIEDRLRRMASLCFAFMCLYLSTHTYYFPWYFPPVTMFGLIVLVRGVFALAGVFARLFPDDVIYGRSKALAVVVLLLIGLRQAALFGLTTWQMAIQDREIEMGHRKVIGLWLKEHTRPGESVYLEPFGYIGYFSGARIVDWPGLVAPDVVRMRKEKKTNMVETAAELKPDWMVLRPSEILEMSQAEFFNSYALVNVFDAAQNLQKYKLLPGPGWLRFDATLSIFKKL